MTLSPKNISELRAQGGFEIISHVQQQGGDFNAAAKAAAKALTKGAEWSMTRSLASNAAAGSSQRALLNRHVLTGLFPSPQLPAGSSVTNAEGNDLICDGDRLAAANRHLQVATGSLMALQQVANGRNPDAVKDSFVALAERVNSSGSLNVLYDRQTEATPFDAAVRLLHSAENGFKTSTSLTSPGNVVSRLLTEVQQGASNKPDSAEANETVLRIATSQASVGELVAAEKNFDPVSDYLHTQGADNNVKAAGAHIMGLRQSTELPNGLPAALALFDQAASLTDDPQAKAAAMLHKGRTMANNGQEQEGIDTMMEALSAPEPETAAFAHLKIGEAAMRSPVLQGLAMLNFQHARALSPNPVVQQKAANAIQQAGYNPDLTSQNPDEA